jgi:hypothetical protein
MSDEYFFLSINISLFRTYSVSFSFFLLRNKDKRCKNFQFILIKVTRSALNVYY